jgi:methylmalonyl-CoA mutase C-terminal domain/subunit
MFPKILELLEKQGAEHIKIFGGGIIPAEDVEKLESMGVAKIFGPGTDTRDIVKYLKQEFE